MKLRRPTFIFFSSIGLMGLLYACSGTQVTDMVDPGPPSVEIDKEVHFLTPDGEDVVVAPGDYEVQAEKEGLRLMAEDADASESLVIEAKPITHEETRETSTALSYSEQEDEHIVMLLLPNGKGLEAQGSYSGVTKRALRSPTVRRKQVRRQFTIRKKIQLKPAQLALSAVSVKYSKVKRPYIGKKSRNTWRLQVSDTLNSGSFSFSWTGQGGLGTQRLRPTSSLIPEIKNLIKSKQCCIKLLINGKPAKGIRTILAQNGSLVTTGKLSSSRSNKWPKTVKLVITKGKKKWESLPTKIYATAVSYYTSVLHPIFSHERCTTCHTLGTQEAIVSMHQTRLGAASYPDNPEAKPHNPNFCGSCHNIPPGSPHTDVDLNNEWFSPDQVQGINWKGWSAGRVCAKVTGPFTDKVGVTGAQFDAQTFNHHFHDDPRILWAVSSGWVPFGRPDLSVPMKDNLQGWFNKVDPWVEAGTPCPKWRFFKRPGRLQQRQLAPRR